MRTNRLLIVAGTILVASLATPGLLGQVNEAPIKTSYKFTRPDQLVSQEPRIAFDRLAGITPEYRIGPGDLLSIKIIGVDNMDQEVRVSASGKISLPYLGLLDAADLTAAELETKISKLMLENKLMKEPDVLIFITEYRAKPVYILGEVDQAGEIFMSQQLYLMDAILMAGGLDYTASDHAFLHRRKLEADPLSATQLARAPGEADASDIEVIDVDLRPLKEGGFVKPNPLLRKGDVLFIPERKVKVYYMIGDLARTGLFAIPPTGDLLVSRAIAGAGGPLRSAKTSEGVLVRYDETGARREQKVDFKAILDGRAPDFKIQPEDLIFIPGSQFKNWGYALVGFVPRMAFLGAALIP